MLEDDIEILKEALKKCAAPTGRYRMDNRYGQDALIQEFEKRKEIAQRALDSTDRRP